MFCDSSASLFILIFLRIWTATSTVSSSSKLLVIVLMVSGCKEKGSVQELETGCMSKVIIIDRGEEKIMCKMAFAMLRSPK